MDVLLPIQHPGEVLRLQVGISLQHLKRLVPRDQCDLHEVQLLFKKPAGRFVAEILEVQVD